MAKKVKKAKPAKSAAKRSVKKPAAKAAKKPVAKQAAAKKKTSKVKPAAPKGHALVSVAPGFTVNDAKASMAWYESVLGFTVQERWEHGGEFRGGAMRSGNVVINFGQDDWKMGRDRVKGQGVRMYIMTGPEIDKYADAIKTRGGVLDQEPQDGWGMRAFSINDPDGYKLTFMTAAKK